MPNTREPDLESPEHSGDRKPEGAHLPRTGRVVGGRYRLVAPLAEGGMGSVWRAEHQTLGHAVAVKFLAGGSAANAEHRARFEREARLAAQIAEESRHVVKVTDHGVDDDGTPWLVMELLHGEALDRRLRREGRLAPALAAEIVRQVSRGLEVAHRRGVVHRDLKPANVFLSSDLSIDDLARRDAAESIHVTILDFGVAKSLWDDDDAPTREGVVLGTPGYMSPEQLQGDARIDARTDVWALGAIAYRAITGRPAFGVGTTQEIAARIAASEPTPPSSFVDDVPPEIDAVLEKALAKDPAARFRSAMELGEALVRVAALSSAIEKLQSTNDGTVLAPAASPPRRRRAALAVIALLSAVVVLFTLGRRPEEDAPTEPAAAQAAPEPQATASPASASAVNVASVPILPAASFGPPAPSASASAEPAKPAAVAPPKPMRKVIDTWHKKDEL